MRVEVKDAGSTDRFDINFEFKFADGAEVGQFEGYASLFGELDRGGDIIEHGAFAESLKIWKSEKDLPPLLWQHDPSVPVGIWLSIVEDSKGLLVKGAFLLDTKDGADAYARVKAKAVKGLSIGYQSKDYHVDKKTGIRHLKQVDLWEISLVTIPMLKRAQIFDVKSDFILSVREVEKALRDGGFSQRDAKIGVSIFQKFLQRDAGDEQEALRDGARDLLMAMRSANERFR